MADRSGRYADAADGEAGGGVTIGQRTSLRTASDDPSMSVLRTLGGHDLGSRDGAGLGRVYYAATASPLVMAGGFNISRASPFRRDGE